MNYDWIAQIVNVEQAAEKELDFEISSMIEMVGIEKFLEIFKLFEKVPYYFSSRKLAPLMACYIRQQNGSKTPTQLARELGVGLRTVHKLMSAVRKKST